MRQRDGEAGTGGMNVMTCIRPACQARASDERMIEQKVIQWLSRLARDAVSREAMPDGTAYMRGDIDAYHEGAGRGFVRMRKE